MSALLVCHLPVAWSIDLAQEDIHLQPVTTVSDQEKPSVLMHA
jgi:hypothetical protein